MNNKFSFIIFLSMLAASCSTIEQIDRMPSDDGSENACLDMVRAIITNEPKNNIAVNPAELTQKVMIKKILNNPALIKDLIKTDSGREAVVKNAIEANLRNAEKLFKSMSSSQQGAKATYKEYTTTFTSIDLNQELKDPYTQLSLKSPDLFVSEALIASSPAEQLKYIAMIKGHLEKIETFNMAIADWNLARHKEAKFHIGDKNAHVFVQSLFSSLVENSFQTEEGKKLLFTVITKLFAADSQLKWSKSMQVAFENRMAPYIFPKPGSLTGDVADLIMISEIIRNSFYQHALDRAKELTVKDSVIRFPGKVVIEGKVDSIVKDANGKPVFIKYVNAVSLKEQAFPGSEDVKIKYRDIPGQDQARHLSGFSSPLGDYKLVVDGQSIDSSNLRPDLLKELAQKKAKVQLDFNSFYHITGILSDVYLHSESKEAIILTFDECTVFDRFYKVLYKKEWGPFDFIAQPEVQSVEFIPN